MKSTKYLNFFRKGILGFSNIINFHGHYYFPRYEMYAVVSLSKDHTILHELSQLCSWFSYLTHIAKMPNIFQNNQLNSWSCDFFCLFSLLSVLCRSCQCDWGIKIPFLSFSENLIFCLLPVYLLKHIFFPQYPRFQVNMHSP